MTMKSIHMKSLQEWTTTIITIILTTQPMKTVLTTKDGISAKANKKKGARYPPTPNTNNPLKNYEQETMDNKSVDETPGMGSAEET